ncbi:hypothetical protein AU106_gp247 [Sinorhizobium phage phiM9]|uniref:Uncharacterized protein n=1 Tax=Sinorhizobium phage phiM9 TaxID=1636182 RepID=A0A0F6R7S2_9CAUD|nr:hypothetical protein AU106_gp247 [Sinorhizobium phage phiM9]AKE44878.1 hypothetical protein Sm_phiM9_251 [Sinorhizobium phage phiM9]
MAKYELEEKDIERLESYLNDQWPSFLRWKLAREVIEKLKAQTEEHRATAD